ncbi:hypothetical protein [Moritella sp. F3]|uniref:hypothetical protein n=1 Tax=Moritella sp. F3 TaxID=2718882 RepID=UPI0018E1A4DF|nr:hypothetical protein [Moritella sp. F3]GIC77726.1 hypothetical protein FMO001_24530 [Moritella sp. F1]GIC82139.1 hypothetical protein FMO003_24200 [Moritella sp. F3]
MNNLKPNAIHALVTVKLAMAANVSDGDDIADQINNLLGQAVKEDIIADFKFTNTVIPVLAQASENPVENELLKTPTAIEELLLWLEDNVEQGTQIMFGDNVYSADVLAAMKTEGYTA